MFTSASKLSLVRWFLLVLFHVVNMPGSISLARIQHCLNAWYPCDAMVLFRIIPAIIIYDFLPCSRWRSDNLQCYQSLMMHGSIISDRRGDMVQKIQIIRYQYYIIFSPSLNSELGGVYILAQLPNFCMYLLSFWWCFDSIFKLRYCVRSSLSSWFHFIFSFMWNGLICF